MSHNVTIYTDFGQQVAEGSLPAGQGGGAVLTFFFDSPNIPVSDLYIVVAPLTGENADFWDPSEGRKGEPHDAPPSGFTDFSDGTFSIQLTADLIPEANEEFVVLVYRHVGDYIRRLEPLDTGVFKVINDDFRGTDNPEQLKGSVYADTIIALAGKDTIFGNRGNDTIFGGTGNDSILGEAGSDVLRGEAGADRLIGGLGNDEYYVDADDTVIEAADAGIDKVYANFSTTLAANVENLRLTGAERIHGTGNRLDNRIDGNSANNKLSGLAGDDSLYGGDGVDILTGGYGRDLLHGGNDDVRDVFVFNLTSESARGAERDQIVSFTSGIDDIDLRGMDANRALAGDQAFAWGGTKAIKNGVWITDTGRDIVVSGDVTGDGKADFEIEVIRIDNLTKTDFWL